MTREFIPKKRDSFREELMTPGCFYLGGKVPIIPDDYGYRLTGFGEPFCIMMHRLPCSENCPDRKLKG
ncbi:MAG: hypothetical protein LUQ32_08905 [Methanomicrobiales archaeon]|nr:hypothetical protein [Methanomicrobiales archaeon]